LAIGLFGRQQVLLLKAADLLRRKVRKRHGGLEREDHHAEVFFNGATARLLRYRFAER